jgi:hypothetical protein
MVNSSCFSITPAAGGTLLLFNAAPLLSEVEAARWRALLRHSFLLAVTIVSSLGSVSRHVFTSLQLTPNSTPIHIMFDVFGSVFTRVRAGLPVL